MGSGEGEGGSGEAGSGGAAQGTWCLENYGQDAIYQCCFTGVPPSPPPPPVLKLLDIDALFLLVVVLLMISTVVIAAVITDRRVSKLTAQAKKPEKQTGQKGTPATKAAKRVADQAAIALSEIATTTAAEFEPALSSTVEEARDVAAQAPVKKSRPAAEVRVAFWRDLLADFRREHTLFGLVLPVPTAVSAKSGRSTHAQRVGFFWLNKLIVLSFLLFQYSSVLHQIAISRGSSRSADVGDISGDLEERASRGLFGDQFLGINWVNAYVVVSAAIVSYVVEILFRCIWWPANYRARRRRRAGHANTNDPSCGHVCGWIIVGLLTFVLVVLCYVFARGYSQGAFLALLSYAGYAFVLVWVLLQPLVLLVRRLLLAALESFAPRLYEKWSRALDVCYRWTLGACRKHVCCEGE